MSRFGQIIDRSASGGRSVKEAWDELFTANERNFEGEKYAMVRDDEQIAGLMKRWFPKRKTLSKVTRARAEFNRRASVYSYRYIKRDDGFVARASARGLRMGPWKRARRPVPKS